jgi:hypothetical protein
MRRLFEDKALQFEKSGKSSLIFQNVATAEGIPVRHSEPYEVSRDEVEEYLADINSNPDTFDLEQMIDLANDMTKFYVFMNWTVLFARPSTAFVTSDCPVFRQFDRPGGDNALLRPDCSVCCPLSSRAFLIMRSDIEYLKVAAREGIEGNGHTLPPTEFRTVSNQGVANFNRNSQLTLSAGVLVGQKRTGLYRRDARSEPSTETYPRFEKRRHMGAMETR